jgi:ATP-dependent Lon protease
VPDDILKGLHIILVTHVDEVLPQALIASAEELYPGRQITTLLCHSLREGGAGDVVGKPTH